MTGRAEPAVCLEGLTKFYPDRKDADGRPVPSVDGVDLTIPAGQVFGLLGPNGAGKSTTIRMIATLLEPTSGRITVCGLDATTQQQAVRGLLGVALGGERSLYWKLTARSNLEYFAALQGRSRKRSRAHIDELLAEVGLIDRADDYVETFSTGMRQRLVIARALINRPSVLLLDEPSSGLDPQAADSLHAQIRQLRERGHTVLLTTHDMSEADSLSDRIAIIDGGRVIGQGTPAELKRTVGADRLLYAQVTGAVADLDAFLRDLGPCGQITETLDNGAVEVSVNGQHGETLLATLIGAASRHNVTVERVTNEAVDLKDVFLALVGRKLGQATDAAPATR